MLAMPLLMEVELAVSVHMCAAFLYAGVSCRLTYDIPDSPTEPSRIGCASRYVSCVILSAQCCKRIQWLVSAAFVPPAAGDVLIGVTLVIALPSK